MKHLNGDGLCRNANWKYRVFPCSILALLVIYIFSTSCKKIPENIIGENNFDSLELAPYVEADFPFISTSLDLRNLGHGLPEWNLTSRGIVMNLGPEAYACFDTDLLRWSLAWTGDHIALTGMAQISYDDFFNKRNKFPVVLGEPKFAIGLYPGWSVGAPQYQDVREKVPPYDENIWGPIPESLGRWEGIMLEDSNGMVLKYIVGDVSIDERPGISRFENQVVFTRNFSIHAHEEQLYLNVAEVVEGKGGHVEESVAYIIQGENQDTVTAVGFVGGSGSWKIGDSRFLTLELGPTSEESYSQVMMWKGPRVLLGTFRDFINAISVENITPHPGENVIRWKEKVHAREIVSPDTAAYVADQLLLPLPNPWKRNVRIMDIDFFEDGRAAVVSFEGDVWLLEGIDRNYHTWSRFASGLNQPMSIEIVQDTIYVFDRLGIHRILDLNGDGEADFYKNFSNVVDQSMETREWPADLVKDPKGGFYIAKGGSLSAGPHIGRPTVKGFARGSQYDGSVLHISEDGRKFEVMATGLRGPYLGIHPETGFLTVTDQQGNFVPSTPVYHVSKGDYYGVPSTAHRVDTPAITPPLLWAPHHIEPSSIGQAWVLSEKMGPLNGQLVHMSFGRPGIYKILIDTVGSNLQGGLIYIPMNYPTPVAKATMRSQDGYLYVAGFNLWGSASEGISSILRMRYTGQPDLLPVAFEAGTQGVILRYDTKLDVGQVENIGNFQVKRYNYRRTPEYGSGHFRLDGSPGQEHIPVLSSHLSEDQKAVLLVVPNMVAVDQMEVEYKLESTQGHKVAGTFAFTLHSVKDLDLEKRGFQHVEIGDLTLRSDQISDQSGEEQTASVELGQQLFNKMACVGCHSPGTRTEGLYGPPFQDLYGSIQRFTDGTEQLVDEEYLRESILEPSVKIVEGYAAEMPSFLGILKDAEIESIILYIQSLSSNPPL